MPQTECPAQEEAWRSTTERTPGAFRRLMSQCGSGVENCLLPDSVAGFVEGEHCSVLLKALGDGHLRPIGSMVDASVRDRNKPGACYVYFRVMKRGETPIRMAFGSVGSSRMEYKARMLFRPRIWTASRAGMSVTGMAWETSTGTPFSQTKQRQTLETLLAMDWAGRGNAEVGIYGRSPWRTLTAPGVCFPIPWTESSGGSKRGRGRGDQMVRRPQPALVRPKGRPANLGRPGAAAYLARPKPRVEGMSAQAKLEEAVRWYQSLSAHLPHVQDRGVVSGAGRHTGFNFPDRRQNHGTMGSNDGWQDVYHRPG